WRLLSVPAVRQRVNDILQAVNTLGYSQTVLFRELWDFIADIALGGSCKCDPPTSAWFWRVFYGESSLSTRLRAITDPMFVVYPQVESHLWYADWHAATIDTAEHV